MTWYNNSWNYRKAITVSNSGSTLSNYQTLVIVDTAILISSSKMRSDCGDIRLADSDGSTLLYYWIESGINSSSTRIWIKIPSISTGTKTVYLYYGNSSATSLSNGDNTFILFDDFTGTNGAIPNAAKWTRNVTGSGAADIQNNTLRTYIPSGNNGLVNSINNISPPCIIELSAKASTLWGSNDPWFGLNDYGVLFGTSSGVFQIGAYGSTWTTWSGYSLDIWYKFRLKYTSTTFTVEEDVRANTYTRTITIPAMVFKFGDNQPHVNGKTMYMDDFRVRQYASPEPTTCVGGEEVKTVSWLTNWNRRRLMTITGSTSSSQTDYQMKIIVHKSSGTDTSTDIYIGTNVKDDFSDLRFTYNDGTTLLNYWIESYTSGSVATVWIKIPSIPISPCTTTIYVYYGNSGASTTSNYANVFIYATGGNVTYSGNYTIHTFLTDGTFTPYFSGNVETLVVAGGGGGGYAGGGGAGGLLTSSSYNVTGPISVVVGNGGQGGSTGVNLGYGTWVGAKGGNSSFGTLIATGGGPGGDNDGAGNLNGGSGGGGSLSTAYAGGIATPSGQGNNGGGGDSSSPYTWGGGGGGAGGAGGSNPGNGGAGVASSITGTSLYYAGGGGGGAYTSWPTGSGGSSIGGGGAGYSNNGGNAIAYRGSGGGGSGLTGGIGGNGSSGIVIVRYLNRVIASPEPTFGTIGTEQISPNITATNMTITPSETPCRRGICTVTIVVRWSNSGGTDGTVIPNITIDTVPQVAHTSRTVIAGSYIDETFTVSDLSAGTHTICPYPN